MRSDNFLKGIFVVLLIGLSLSEIMAQTNVRDMPTSKVDTKVNGNAKSNRPATKQVKYIYLKKQRQQSLVGNPCAIQATRKMGFEYQLEHNPKAGFKSGFKRRKHNMGVKIKLFFTKGPWWKSKVNKKIKKCAGKSGDRRG